MYENTVLAHVRAQIKAQEAARYAHELEEAQREAALEKQRRKEAYAQCVPMHCSKYSATKHGSIVHRGTAPCTVLLSTPHVSRRSHSALLGLLHCQEVEQVHWCQEVGRNTGVEEAWIFGHSTSTNLLMHPAQALRHTPDHPRMHTVSRSGGQRRRRRARKRSASSRSKPPTWPPKRPTCSAVMPSANLSRPPRCSLNCVLLGRIRKWLFSGGCA